MSAWRKVVVKRSGVACLGVTKTGCRNKKQSGGCGVEFDALRTMIFESRPLD